MSPQDGMTHDQDPARPQEPIDSQFELPETLEPGGSDLKAFRQDAPGGYGYGYQSTVGDVSHLGTYLRILHKRRWTALAAFAVLFGSVVVYTFTVTPIYEATAQVLIENASQSVVSFEEVLQQNKSVNVVNAAGTTVGTAVTTATGSFSVGGLTAGTFTVNVVGASGAVLSTTTATLAAGAMTATVTATVGAAALAGAGAGAAGVGAAVAGGGAAAGIGTGVIVGTVAAVGTGIGVAAAVATKDDASPSR